MRTVIIYDGLHTGETIMFHFMLKYFLMFPYTYLCYNVKQCVEQVCMFYTSRELIYKYALCD